MAIMRRFILARFSSMLFVIWAVGTFAFFLVHLIPGDPVYVMLGDEAHPDDVARLRKDLGLDQPLVVQYGQFWWKVIRGDLGHSVFTGEAVFPVLIKRLGMSALLGISALGWAILFALPLAWLSARHPHTTVDHTILVGTTLGIAMPSMWIAPLLMLFFSIRLGWFPVSGSGTWKHIVLPSLTLGAGLMAYLTRFARASFIDTFHQPFVLSAQARGIRKKYMYLYYIFKPASIPIVTVVGLQLGALLTGTVITETIFAWPGLGRYLVQAIFSRDYPVVQGCILLFGVTYSVMNFVVDLLYAWLDPRARSSLIMDSAPS